MRGEIWKLNTEKFQHLYPEGWKMFKKNINNTENDKSRDWDIKKGKRMVTFSKQVAKRIKSRSASFNKAWRWTFTRSESPSFKMLWKNVWRGVIPQETRKYPYVYAELTAFLTPSDIFLCTEQLQSEGEKKKQRREKDAKQEKARSWMSEIRRRGERKDGPEKKRNTWTERWRWRSERQD